MNRLIAIGVAALFFAAAVPNVNAGHETGHSRTEFHAYIPGASPALTVWCSEEHHAWIPLEPTNPWLDAPDGWLFSGEPECAPHDATNIAREAQGQPRETGGYGGAAFTIQEGEQLATLKVNTDDVGFGVGASYISLSIGSVSGNVAASEGCGPQEVTVPEDPPNHWQSSPDNPLYLGWARVPVAFADADNNLCFSSTGMIDGEFAK